MVGAYRFRINIHHNRPDASAPQSFNSLDAANVRKIAEIQLEQLRKRMTAQQIGLDVTEEQPLGADSPLWDMDTVYLTPHCTPQVPNRAGRSIEIIKENARRFEAGEPLLNLLRPTDAMNGEKAEGGWSKMLNTRLTKEQAAKIDFEKYLGKRGWSDPSEWM